jgi:hypothetical protein
MLVSRRAAALVTRQLGTTGCAFCLFVKRACRRRAALLIEGQPARCERGTTLSDYPRGVAVAELAFGGSHAFGLSDPIQALHVADLPGAGFARTPHIGSKVGSFPGVRPPTTRSLTLVVAEGTTTLASR